MNEGTFRYNPLGTMRTCDENMYTADLMYARMESVRCRCRLYASKV